jgi:hypothetical protein
VRFRAPLLERQWQRRKTRCRKYVFDTGSKIGNPRCLATKNAAKEAFICKDKITTGA